MMTLHQATLAAARLMRTAFLAQTPGSPRRLLAPHEDEIIAMLKLSKPSGRTAIEEAQALGELELVPSMRGATYRPTYWALMWYFLPQAEFAREAA